MNPLGADGIAGTEDDNLRLQAGSPCIDAGNNAAVPSGVTTDLAGNRRFDNDTSVTDTGSGTAPIVDMGAYERAFKPWAVADSATVHHGAAVTIPVLANDVTLDGGALSITGITQGTHGSVVINGDKVVYTADLNFSGTDGFTYTVTVGAAPPDTGTVTVNVTNTAPVADGQTVSTHWGTAKAVTLTGNDADNDSITFSIVADPQHGTLSGAIPNLTYTPTGAYVGGDSFTFKVNDGAADSNVATVSIDVTNTTPVADGQTVSPHSGTAKAITLTGGDADGDAITFAVVAQPQHGALSGTVPNLTYTPTAGYAGSDSFTFKVNDGVADSNVATVSIDVTNTAPAVTTSASPTSVIPGGTVVFSADGTDPDGDALSYSWDFGDGTTSSEQSPTHAYAAAGVYTATVTVTDSAGATGSASVTIQVSKAPTVRLTTSDVVAFGGNPFTFDAGASTDPENAIASYTWDFGDGTPPGAGQVISKVYDSPGEYTVTLTVTDAAGVSTTLTRVIQVLSADEMGLFSGFVTYQVRWDRNKTNKDSLSLSASVNVGDTVVGPDTLVALEIAGLRFTGTLDKKLRDYSNANAKWQVKAGQRKQPYGAVLVKVKIKNASLGEGFNLAGAHVGADPTDTVSVDIPAKIEIGDRSFEVVVPSDFDFNNDGTKAKGNGEF
ncbi:MAG: Ig-like domain-containing protein [Planctomycetota bacterium]|nr:Ig-like domain-containing protein [Planctomycetota bacterium]